MTGFPFFDPGRKREGIPANHANPANLSPEISTISNISSSPSQNLCAETFIEDMEERAAIMEFDGGMTRQDAEVAAYKGCKIIYLNRKG